MNKTNISWCDMTWNPFVGCDKHCTYCYARLLHDRRHKAFMDGKKLPPQYAQPYDSIQEFPSRLEEPARKNSPSTVFVGSMGDISCVSDEFKKRVFSVVTDCPQHQFMFLTKNPGSLKDWDLSTFGANDNLWMGATATNQSETDRMMNDLLAVKAPYRFLSLEPLTGRVVVPFLELLDLVIVGGQTGPDSAPMDIEWVRGIRDQCIEAGTRFHFKQWGDYPTNESYEQRHGINAQIHMRHNGWILDGREYRWYPGKDER